VAKSKTKSVGGKELPASAFAYVGDPEDTSTWHLPIHDEAHAQDAMSRFNQTEGIPASEKKAVAKKIANKAKSFGINTENFEKEYARSLDRSLEELRASLPRHELRVIPAHIELRRTDQGPQIHMSVPYNSESESMGGFREVVRPGAFAKTMKEQDIVSLWNHQPEWVLGRTANKTLQLRSNDDALEGKVQLDGEDPMHTHFARRVERGDVSGTSFGFEKVRDNWEGTASDGLPLRSLVEARLSDVSPVTFPAYPEATAEKRSLLDVASVQAGVDLSLLVAAIVQAEGGTIKMDLAQEVRQQLEKISRMLPLAGRSDEDRLRLLRRAERIVGGAPVA